MATLLERMQASKERRQLGPAASFGIGALQGATFNFGDELYGLGAALIPGGQDYDQAVEAARSAYERARPGYRIAGELTGAIATPGLGAAGFIGRGATAASKLGRAAQVGAATGAVAGAGAGEDGIANRAVSGAQGAALGGVLGAGAQATLGRLARPQLQQTADGADEAAKRGIRLSLGQKTGDLDQLAKEQELLNLRTPGRDQFSEFIQDQGRDVQRAIDDTASRLGPVDTIEGAAGDFIGSFKSAEANAERAVSEAYEAVRNVDAKFKTEGAGDVARDLANRFQATISDDQSGIGLNPEVGEFLANVAKRTIRASGLKQASKVANIERKLSEAVRKGADPEQVKGLQAELTGAIQIAEQTTPTIQRIEGIRKGINSAYRRESDPTRKAGLSRMVSDVDDWMEASITAELFDGSDEVVDQLKKARGLAREYHTIFGTGGKTTDDRAADRLIQTLITDHAGPDEAYRFLTRMQSIGGTGTQKAIERIEKGSPEAFQMLKSAAFSNLAINQRTGQTLTPLQIASNIDRLTNRQTGIARRLYGAEGVKDLRGLSSALKATDQQLQRTGNASRSGFAAANMLRGFSQRIGVALGAVGDPTAAFGAMLAPTLGNVDSILQARRAMQTTVRPSRFAALARRAQTNAGRTAPAFQDQLGPDRRNEAQQNQALDAQTRRAILEQLLQQRGASSPPQGGSTPQQQIINQQSDLVRRFSQGG